MKKSKVFLSLLIGMIVSITLTSCEKDEPSPYFMHTLEYEEFFTRDPFISIPYYDYYDSEWRCAYIWSEEKGNWMEINNRPNLLITKSGNSKRILEFTDLYPDSTHTYPLVNCVPPRIAFADEHYSDYYYFQFVKEDVIIIKYYSSPDRYFKYLRVKSRE